MDPTAITSSADAIDTATSLIVSAASSLLVATSTVLADLPDPTSIVNGTIPSVLDPGDPLDNGNYVLVRHTLLRPGKREEELIFRTHL